MPRVYSGITITFKGIASGWINVEDVLGVRMSVDVNETLAVARAWVHRNSPDLVPLFDLMVERGMILGAMDGPQELENG